MKKKRTWHLKYVFGAAGFVFLFLLWWLVSYLMRLGGNFLLPYPFPTLERMVGDLFGGGAYLTYPAIGWTLLRIVIGFAVSFLLGGLFGTIAGLHGHFGDFMGPFVVFSRAVPTAAVVIILVAVFTGYRGMNTFTPCFLVFLVAFPLIYEAFRKGIASESKETRDALRIECGDKSIKAVFAVLLPDAWNYIALGLAQSLGLSVKVSIMSEILVNSSEVQGGLGGLIQNARLINFDMTAVVAYSLIAVLLSLLMDIPLSILKRSVKKKIG
jgi:ABC-type nitrate/sulfonate/bicarbonate transport system permease component